MSKKCKKSGAGEKITRCGECESLEALQMGWFVPIMQCKQTGKVRRFDMMPDDCPLEDWSK